MWPYAERYSVVDMQTVPNGTCVSVESRVVSMTFGNSQETVTQVSAMHIPCNLYESEIRHRIRPTTTSTSIGDRRENDGPTPQ